LLLIIKYANNDINEIEKQWLFLSIILFYWNVYGTGGLKKYIN